MIATVLLLAVLFVIVVFPATCLVYLLVDVATGIGRLAAKCRPRSTPTCKYDAGVQLARAERDRILRALRRADLDDEELNAAHRAVREDYRDRLEQVFRTTPDPEVSNGTNPLPPDFPHAL